MPVIRTDIPDPYGSSSIPQASPLPVTPQQKSGKGLFEGVAKDTGRFVKGIFTAPFSIAKDVADTFWTIGVKQPIWAFKGAKGLSPLEQKWERQSKDAAKAVISVRYGDLPEETLEAKAGEFMKAHPNYKQWFGPLNTILDVTMFAPAGAIAKSAPAAWTRTGFKNALQSNNQMIQKSAQWLDDFRVAIKDKRATVDLIDQKVMQPLAEEGKYWSEYVREWKGILKKNQPDWDDARFVREVEGIEPFARWLKGETVREVHPETMRVLEFVRDVIKDQTKRYKTNFGKVADEVYDRQIRPFLKEFGEEVTKDGARVPTKEAIRQFQKETGIDPAYWTWQQFEKYGVFDLAVPAPLRKISPKFAKQAELKEAPRTIESLAYRELQESKHTLVNEAIEQVQKEFGKSVVRGSDEFLELQGRGWQEFDATKLKHFPVKTETGSTVIGMGKNSKAVMLPKGTSDVVNRLFNTMSDAEKIARAVVDPIVDVWRFSVLALSPRWYVNNTIGNFVLNLLAGMHPFNPRTYTSYYKALKKNYRESVPVGVNTGGFFRAEFDTARFAAAPGAKMQKFFKAVEKPLNINNEIENYFRRANFIFRESDLAAKRAKIYSQNIATEGIRREFKKFNFDEITKNLSADDVAKQELAVKEVDRALNNYRKNLTPLERSLVRRIFPFYNWYKFIFKRTADLAINDPKRLILLYKFWNELGPVDDPDLPPWLQGRIPLSMTMKDPNTGKDTPLFLTLRGAMPFSDVVNLDLPRILAATNPIMKVAMERGFRRDIFKGKDFSSMYYDPYTGMTYDPETGEFEQRPPVKKLFNHMAEQLPTFTFIRDLFFEKNAMYDVERTPILDKKGKPLYKDDLWTDVFKQFGINVLPFDAGQYLKDKQKSTEATKKYVKERLRRQKIYEIRRETEDR